MEAKILAKEYKSHYNREDCADALGYCTPAELSLGRCVMWPTWMRCLRRSYNRRPHS